MYPLLEINSKKIQKNIKTVKNLCEKHGINVMAITKVVGGQRDIVDLLSKSGITFFGDSRIDNIINYYDIEGEKCLIRMPSIDEVEKVVKYCDVSLNSEIAVLGALDKEAIIQHKIHKVILMVDLGDLREGYFDELELEKAIRYVRDSRGLELYGLGTNLTCFGFVRPDEENMYKLAFLAKKYNAITCVSGGNSANLALMLEGKMPTTINNLRLGEALFFGRERSSYKYLSDTRKDAFILKTQIIECKAKPSYPIGTIGKNSYGVTPKFKDKGIRKRVICKGGKQDFDPEIMWPIDSGIEIIGASSDHLVLDITDAKKEYQVGDIVEFRLGYMSVMRAFTSKYVKKELI